jgi:hypothetical protein
MTTIKMDESRYSPELTLNSDELAKAITTAQNYFCEKTKLEQAINTARREYQEPRQQKEVKALQEKLTDLRDNTLASINASFAKPREVIATKRAKIEQKNKSMKSDLINDDFRFLETTAVTLTQSELQILVDKHPDNFLFRRAAREYANKNQLKIITPLEAIEFEENAIAAAVGSLQHFVQRTDAHGFSIFVKRRAAEHDAALAEKKEGWYQDEPEEPNTPEEPEDYRNTPVDKLNFDTISRDDILDVTRYSAEQHAAWRKHHGI